MSLNTVKNDFGSARHCMVCLKEIAQQVEQGVIESAENVVAKRHSLNTEVGNHDQEMTCKNSVTEANCEAGAAANNLVFIDMQPKTGPKGNCAGCGLIRYCSPEHQQLDWPAHKDFCKVMKYVKETCNVGHPLLINGKLDARRLQLSIKQLTAIVYVRLNRLPTPLEVELLSYPACCVICYELKNVMHCAECQGISYCGMAHLLQDKPRHAKECKKLRLYYCVYKLVPLKNDLYRAVHKREPNLQLSDLYEAVTRATLINLPTDPTESFLSYNTFALASTFSHVATLCLAMTYLEVISTKDDLYKIYILGATVEKTEFFQQIHMEFFFLQNDKITNLELNFVGPDLVDPFNETRIYNYNGKQRTVSYKNHVGLFQEFSSGERINKAALMIAYNPDFAERLEWIPRAAWQYQPDAQKKGNPPRATWKDALDEILHSYDVPLFFTSPTELDAKLDYGAVLEVAKESQNTIIMRRVFEFNENPYAEIRPQRNMRRGEPEHFYYNNRYLQGVLTTF